MRGEQHGQAPLWEALKSYTEQRMVSWHTPGHKGGRHTGRDFYNRLGEFAFQMDLTELPGLDNLSRPQGVIKEAQDKAAHFFRAGQTFFLVNGASSGIMAVILATCRPGDVVLMPRYAHRSAFAGLILSGARPVYLRAARLPELDLILGVEPSEVEKALEVYPEAKLLLVVHPTYEGLVPDTGRLINLAHARGLKVLVDAAHGSHFGLDPRLPASPLDLGADYVVHGTHKTLGAFTQAAMLHVRQGVEGGEVGRALQILQTSSPSYLLLASLDIARWQAELCGRELWARAVDRSLELRAKLRMWGLPCLEMADIRGEAAAGLDVTRLVIPTAPLGRPGPEVGKALRELGHEMEMAAWRYIVGILTPAEGKEQTDGLLEALRCLKLTSSYSGRCTGTAGDTALEAHEMPSPPPIVLTPREAFMARRRVVPLKEAAGRIAAELIAPCPPGVALVVPGEVLTEELVDRLTDILGEEAEVQVVDL